MTPYYTDDLITLYHGDALDVLCSLDEFDMTFTSPPYNLSTTTGGGFGHYSGSKWTNAALADGYDDHGDNMTPEEYADWQRSVLAALWDHTSPTGAVFYNHKPRVQAKTLWTPLDVNPGLPVRQIVIWARSSGMNFSPTNYCPTHEWIVVFARPDWRLTSRGASGVGDVWSVPPDHGNPHPAPFPVSLPARAIETAGPGSVLDPFVGSGSTMVAARAAGIRGVGIDKSERYLEMAVKRIAQGSLFEGTDS